MAYVPQIPVELVPSTLEAILALIDKEECGEASWAYQSLASWLVNRGDGLCPNAAVAALGREGCASLPLEERDFIKEWLLLYAEKNPDEYDSGYARGHATYL